MKPAHPNINRILVIRFSSFGDLVLISPLFRALKIAFPKAQVDFVVAEEFKALHQFNPFIHNHYGFDRRKSFFSLFFLAWRLKKRQYQILLDAHGSLRSRILTFLLQSFGFFSSYKKKRNFFQTSLVSVVDKKSILRRKMIQTKILPDHWESQRQKFLSLLQSLPKEVFDPAFFFKTLAEETEIFFPENFLEKKIPLAPKKTEMGVRIAIAPGAAYPLKEWAKENFLELIKILSPNHSIFLLGGKKEEKMMQTWEAQMQNFAVQNWVGRLNFLENAALLKICQILITNDSGLLHLAEAVKTPVISLFGPTVPAFGFAPFLKKSQWVEVVLPCRPCSLHGQGPCTNPIKQECMKKISVKSVLEKIKNLGIPV